MRVAFLFIDGVGVGVKDPAINPLARQDLLLSRFQGDPGLPLPGGGTVHPLETTFGVPGRPQSATNQAALLTGEPAPRHLGRHLLGFPNATLRELIDRRSIVRALGDAGRRSGFLNAYPAGYLDALALPRRPAALPEVVIPEAARRRLRPSAMKLAMAAGNVALRTLDDARRHEALTNDIDGRRARAHGFDVPLRSPEEAAALFWAEAAQVDFALFDHYLADEAGHARDFERAHEALLTFDRFARAVVATRPQDAELIVCSDHGNVEDLSTRSHTTHKVALLRFGRGPAPALSTVADVGEHILRVLEVER